MGDQERQGAQLPDRDVEDAKRLRSIFCHPPEAGRSFGWTLQREAAATIEARDIEERAAAAGRAKSN